AQFEKLETLIKKRKEIAAIYTKELEGCPHVTTPILKRDSVFTQYIIKIDKNRDGFARELRDAGINIGLHYIPLHLLSYYKNKYNLRVNDFPVALKVYQQVLSLPIYAALEESEIKYICDTIKSVAKTRV
ncbi:MAG: DegT/DnrJ/EryC1/StrS family aminotransferase, partial [Campylobacter hyointestinalis]